MTAVAAPFPRRLSGMGTAPVMAAAAAATAATRRPRWRRHIGRRVTIGLAAVSVGAGWSGGWSAGGWGSWVSFSAGGAGWGFGWVLGPGSPGWWDSGNGEGL